MSEATKAGASVKTDIKDRVKQVLTEARVVIPGAQALLGFQLVAMLTEEFSKLPEVSVDVHVVSLLMITLAIILLMAPAAYHRIVDRGENTEAFERFAGKMILSAMIALAAGVCGDLYVVIRKIFQDPATAAAVALAMLALFYALWFGMPLYLRSRHRARA